MSVAGEKLEVIPLAHMYLNVVIPMTGLLALYHTS